MIPRNKVAYRNRHYVLTPENGRGSKSHRIQGTGLARELQHRSPDFLHGVKNGAPLDDLLQRACRAERPLQVWQ